MLGGRQAPRANRVVVRPVPPSAVPSPPASSKSSSSKSKPAPKEPKLQNLEKFATNLNEYARQGKFDNIKTNKQTLIGSIHNLCLDKIQNKMNNFY